LKEAELAESVKKQIELRLEPRLLQSGKEQVGVRQARSIAADREETGRRRLGLLGKEEIELEGGQACCSPTIVCSLLSQVPAAGSS
jgi:hypothetical protein